jgi:hypothetical protein
MSASQDVQTRSITFGLSAIKGCGAQAAAALVADELPEHGVRNPGHRRKHRRRTDEHTARAILLGKKNRLRHLLSILPGNLPWRTQTETFHPLSALDNQRTQP